jgi:glutamate/tyrosine decarboxylase-like PLP-dependent enzyme
MPYRMGNHTMKYWKKLSHEEQDARISEALRGNIDFRNLISLGIPASRLDKEVFHENAPFLKDAPLLRTYVQNPNHIGCHTLGDSEKFFAGTQEIEREVISALSEDLLHAAPGSCDGYIASGGTEANIQAAWIYRNLFINEHNAKHSEIALLASSDTHYSVAKAANLLNLQWLSVPVDHSTREIVIDELNKIISTAKENGFKYFIVFANMATTMFGSVDNPDVYVDALKAHDVLFKMHVDGAFGGFIYPVSCPESNLNFHNPHISSVTLDAHKMLQAPYGTGVFLARKQLMHHVYTKEAQYVNGMDITLSGSRSGANAVAVWMILMTYGPFGYLEKINKLLYRTDWCCNELDRLNIKYYRHPAMNIITITAEALEKDVASRFGLVPDTHGTAGACWYKIVVMDHVEIEHLQEFIRAIERRQYSFAAPQLN